MKKFFTKRNIFAFSIIAAGVLFSFYIIGKAKQSEPVVAVNVADVGVPPQFDFETNQLPNLTSQFANRSLEELVKKNEQAVSAGVTDPKQLTLLPDDDDIQKIIDELIENDRAYESVSISKVKKSDDNSKEMQMAYLIAVDYISRKNAGAISPEDIEKKNMSQYFYAVSKNAGETLEILEEMNVPPSWADVHAKIISYYIKQKNLYASLSSAEVDPLRYMVAATRLPYELQSDLDAINKLMEERMRVEGLI